LIITFGSARGGCGLRLRSWHYHFVTSRTSECVLTDRAVGLASVRLPFSPRNWRSWRQSFSSLPGLHDAKTQRAMCSLDLLSRLQSSASRQDLFSEKSIWERQPCWEQRRLSSCSLPARIHYGSV